MNEAQWLTIKQVMQFEEISRQEVCNRRRLGHPRRLIFRNREDGKPGTLIDARSMTFYAQQRWRKSLLETADSPKTEAARGQLDLLPRTEVDDQIDALKCAESERAVILRRYRIVTLFLNCNWKA
jgi:hypothetical protein